MANSLDQAHENGKLSGQSSRKYVSIDMWEAHENGKFSGPDSQKWHIERTKLTKMAHWADQAHEYDYLILGTTLTNGRPDRKRYHSHSEGERRGEAEKVFERSRVRSWVHSFIVLKNIVSFC